MCATHFSVLITVIFCGWTVQPAVAAQTPEKQYTIINAEDFQVTPDTEKDMGAPLSALIQQIKDRGEPSILQLGKGIFYLYGEHAEHSAIVIDNTSDMIIRGMGPETRVIVRNPRIGAFFVSNGNNTWVEALSIDYNPLPYTQGTVLAINRAAGWFDLAVNRHYAPLSESWFSEAPKPFGQWGMIFDAKEATLKTGASDFIFIDQWEKIGDYSWRIFPVKEQVERLNDMRMGCRYVQLARYGRGGAVFFWRCRESGVRNIEVYASQSVAIGSAASDRITVEGVSVLRKPGSKRLISTDAGAVLVQQNLRGPVIENCRFESMADDGVAVYGTPNQVKAVVSPSALRTERKGEIAPGDRLCMFEPVEGRILVTAHAIDVQDAPDNEYRVTLDQVIPNVRIGESGAFIYNISRCGADFVVRGNTFENHRRHGMMIMAQDGLIEGNTIRDLGGLGILLGNAPGAPEGGIPSGIIIRGNHILNVGRSRWYGIERKSAAIQVFTLAAGGKTAVDRGVKDILLEGNDVVNPPGAALYIGSAADITVKGLHASYTKDYMANHKTATVILENAASVRMSGIQVDSLSPLVEYGVLIEDSVAPGSTGVQVDDIHVSAPIDIEAIMDKRK